MNRLTPALCLLLCAVAVVPARRAVAQPAATQAASQPAGQLDFILKQLRTIQPATHADKDVEAALVAKGTAILPALREAKALGDKIVRDDELTTDRYSVPGQGTVVDGRPREARVKELAERRMVVLDHVIVPLDWGFDPKDVLAKWAAKRDAKGADAKTLLNEPQQMRGAILEAAFPEYLWYSITRPYSPVQRVEEEPSSWLDRNLFAIDRKGNVTHLTSANDLQAFFRSHLQAVKEEQDAKQAVRVWLALSQTLQDHNQFPVVEDSLKATKAEGGGWTAKGQASRLPMGAKAIVDVGTVDVALVFDADGKLKEKTEDVKVRPGMRPICQATKLLDKDLIVRTMAERELRLMGRDAEEYLRMRRASASPELQAAIDRIWQKILADEVAFGR